MSRGTRPEAYGLDTFGAPSPEEAAAGMPVHGEAPVVRYEVSAIPDGMCLAATLAKAQLRFERRIRLAPGSKVLLFSETLENLSPSDRPIAWTQHVTDRKSTRLNSSHRC